MHAQRSLAAAAALLVLSTSACLGAPAPHPPPQFADDYSTAYVQYQTTSGINGTFLEGRIYFDWTHRRMRSDITGYNLVASVYTDLTTNKSAVAVTEEGKPVCIDSPQPHAYPLSFWGQHMVFEDTEPKNGVKTDRYSVNFSAAGQHNEGVVWLLTNTGILIATELTMTSPGLDLFVSQSYYDFRPNSLPQQPGFFTAPC